MISIAWAQNVRVRAWTPARLYSSSVGALYEHFFLSSQARALTYQLASEVAGGWPSLRRVAGRTSDDGQTTTFAVPAALRDVGRPDEATSLLAEAAGIAEQLGYVVARRRAEDAQRALTA